MGLLSFKKKQIAVQEFVNEIREHSRLGFVKDRELEKLVFIHSGWSTGENGLDFLP